MGLLRVGLSMAGLFMMGLGIAGLFTVGLFIAGLVHGGPALLWAGLWIIGQVCRDPVRG